MELRCLMYTVPFSDVFVLNYVSRWRFSGADKTVAHRPIAFSAWDDISGKRNADGWFEWLLRDRNVQWHCDWTACWGYPDEYVFRVYFRPRRITACQTESHGCKISLPYTRIFFCLWAVLLVALSSQLAFRSVHCYLCWLIDVVACAVHCLNR